MYVWLRLRWPLWLRRSQFQSIYYPSKLTASTITRVHQRASVLRSADENIHAIVRLCDEADLDRLAADYGVAFNVVTGNLATAVIPMSALVDFAEDPDVENVDAGNSVKAMTDLAREYSHVDALHVGLPDFPRSFTGKGVLIGVIDTGFDFMHPAFRDAGAIVALFMYGIRAVGMETLLLWDTVWYSIPRN